MALGRVQPKNPAFYPEAGKRTPELGYVGPDTRHPFAKTSPEDRGRAAALTLCVAVASAGYVAFKRRAGLPSPGSEASEQTTRQFFRGLAALQVGLVDAAEQEVAPRLPCAG